jgi:hypothetical protein
MKVDFSNTNSLMGKAIQELIWEYHLHRLETQEWYRELHKKVGMPDHDVMNMNMTQYLYDKYGLTVAIHKGYRVEISYSEDGVEQSRKTVPEIQGLTITEKGLTDDEVKQKVLQIASRLSD